MWPRSESPTGGCSEIADRYGSDELLETFDAIMAHGEVDCPAERSRTIPAGDLHALPTSSTATGSPTITIPIQVKVTIDRRAIHRRLHGHVAANCRADQLLARRTDVRL